MLIQFRVENHRSLRDEASLLLTASSSNDPDPRLLRPATLGEALLPVITIYGANASGKSNLVKALSFFRHAVLDSYRRWNPDDGVPTEPFALSAKRDEPTLFEVDIVVDEVRYRYGTVLSSTRVEEEWLYAWPNGTKQVWFEREGDAFSFGRNFKGENEAIKKLTRPNSLFLSSGAQNNHQGLLGLFAWFAKLTIPNIQRGFEPQVPSSWLLGRFFSGQLDLFPDQRVFAQEAVLKLLRAADTGITEIRVEESEGRRSFRDRNRGAVQLLFHHQAENPDDPESWLPLEAQSAGTIALLKLAPPFLDALRSGGVIFMDELEASLHPMLALTLLNMFQDPEQNIAGGQLIFTTHDTNLLGNAMGESPLRRDQVWFTEKDKSGATRLYPLTDFHPRKSENLERGYLQGRYGAVPFLGDLDVREVTGADPASKEA